MSYQALYRQWRPLDFDEVIGQSHITVPLKNQIKANSIGHAYVFSGTRGTGKTSTAKVFARAVNCLNNKDGNPCNQCENCMSILDEQFIDVIEMDAASNNSVDDIRELREHIKFAPSNGKYKVYIIDEVHMLSSGAFNALLKTLEEPPGYVLFILATTEVHKIPQTILSRCQRFDFKRVSQEDIFARLAFICKKLNVVYEDEALRLIIRKSDGAVRDSLSSLDQCLSIGGNALTVVGVIEMLGLVEKNMLLDLIRYMAVGKSGEALTMVNGILSDGKDITQFVNGIIDVYRDLLVVKLIDENHHLLINASQDYIDLLIELSKQFTEPQIARGLNAFIELSKSIKYAQNQRIVFEATLVKVLHPEADTSNEALLERIAKLEQKIAQGYIANKSDSPLVKSAMTTETTEKTTEIAVENQETAAAGEIPVESADEVDVKQEDDVLKEPFNEVEKLKESTSKSDEAPHEAAQEALKPEETASDAKKEAMNEKVSDIIEFTDSALTFEMVNEVWHTFMETVQREKKGIYPALEGAAVADVSGNKITIGLRAENKLFVGVLESKQNYDYLNQLMHSLVKHVIQLAFMAVDNEKASDEPIEKQKEQEIMAFFKEYQDVLEIK
ncbi:DNA polymerase III subunit gamma/tau [Fusibacter paucivorans]|uniref:DNA-directed DNA polymerase n=1 Tax=Fusibacter paucivorans TaxID=76009 RepID=A0ABS5PN03_9FIRM|nr:DNA polymerase III subunit gamma/tau [Fusibacter paucivorans]MBS7526543.1 DNA polymerase III subunit gamma/tau [Fusibacter paucivorans]